MFFVRVILLGFSLPPPVWAYENKVACRGFFLPCALGYPYGECCVEGAAGREEPCGDPPRDPSKMESVLA